MKFSIVTICRNNLNGLIKTYESLKIQEFRDFQEIIIDGKSTDGTLQWLERYVGTSSDWISEKDTGIYSAMNKGLDKAKGRFIIFLNSGDMFADKHVLKKVSMAIDQHGSSLDYIYGDSIDIFLEKEFYRKARHCSTLVRGMFTQHQAMFFNVQSLGNIRFQEQYIFSADYAFIGQYLYKLQFNSACILKLEFPICMFLLGGVSEKYRLRILKEDFLIRHECFHQSLFVCILLAILHFLHLISKRIFPNLSRWVRYKFVAVL